MLISAALGMAIAWQLKGENKHHIAVIGDASIASGMAFEGLNHAGVTDANLLVILNDNAMGIDPSVGALKEYLTAVKEGKNPKLGDIAHTEGRQRQCQQDAKNAIDIVSHARPDPVIRARPEAPDHA